jgi:hypothetical protein
MRWRPHSGQPPTLFCDMAEVSSIFITCTQISPLRARFFMNSPWTAIMEDPKHFVLCVYTWITERTISDPITERVIQKFSYPGILRAVPRYFNNSSFRAEWLARRNRLLHSCARLRRQDAAAAVL